MTDDPPSFGHLVLASNGRSASITLDRPEKLNPLGAQTLAELTDAARWLEGQPDLRVVVVSGRGRAFSAGSDLAEVVGGAEVRTRSVRDQADLGRRMADAMEAIPAVTVAALRGYCIGGGLVLASACDLRVAASDTVFAIPELELGVPLAWGGIPRLIREIGAPATRDLVMTCRRFDADEASRLGLVQRVVAPELLDDTVTELVATLLAKPRAALLATKRHVDAITAGMVGTARSWADADALLAAARDPEALAAGAAYVASRQRS